MKTITLEDNIFTALLMTLQQAAGTTTPIITPPEVKPVEPQPQPVHATPIDREMLLTWLAQNHADFAGQYGHIVEFSIARSDLQDPKAIFDAYDETVTHPPTSAAVDVMYNAGIGFAIADVRPADAFFLFRRGQQVGKKLYYPILAGTQSQIGALIQWVEAGDQIVPAQAFDADSYAGPIRPYVERFLSTGSLTG